MGVGYFVVHILVEVVVGFHSRLTHGHVVSWLGQGGHRCCLGSEMYLVVKVSCGTRGGGREIFFQASADILCRY